MAFVFIQIAPPEIQPNRYNRAASDHFPARAKISATPKELKSAINKNKVRAVGLAANSRSSARLLLARRFFLVCRLHILMVSAFPLAVFTLRFIDRTFRSSSLQARKSYVLSHSGGYRGRGPIEVL